MNLKALQKAKLTIMRFAKLGATKGFKIGKTNNPYRRKMEYEQNDYTIFRIIAECQSIEEANYIESALIKEFKSIEDFIPIDCINKRNGGGGNTAKTDKYYIYIAIK